MVRSLSGGSWCGMVSRLTHIWASEFSEDRFPGPHLLPQCHVDLSPRRKKNIHPGAKLNKPHFFTRGNFLSFPDIPANTKGHSACDLTAPNLRSGRMFTYKGSTFILGGCIG